MKLSVKAKYWATDCHSETNHKYDGQPYEFHLKMVSDVAEHYLHLLPRDEMTIERVFAACWAHDVIEDCRQTYSDVKKELGVYVADIVYACTNEKGKNRKERASDKFYDELIKVKYAPFVKICDRIANMRYSLVKRSNMALKYAAELPDFAAKIGGDEYPEMIQELYSLSKASIEIIAE